MGLKPRADPLRSRVADVVARLTAAIVARAARRGVAPPPLRPGPPAAPGQLATLERALGRELPPSYRAFLELHDGHRGLAGPGDLLATSEVLPGGAWHARIRRWRQACLDADLDDVRDAIVV